jgi:hypothetical protein
MPMFNQLVQTSKNYWSNKSYTRIFLVFFLWKFAYIFLLYKTTKFFTQLTSYNIGPIPDFIMNITPFYNTIINISKMLHFAQPSTIYYSLAFPKQLHFILLFINMLHITTCFFSPCLVFFIHEEQIKKVLNANNINGNM